jgi:CRP-like cAMP-binding protein
MDTDSCLFQKYYPEDTVVGRAPKGRTLFMPYQSAEYVYHLHSGIVCTLIPDKEGFERLSLLILPNQFIGLAGFVGMDGDRQVVHAGEARAITPVVYCKIRRELAWKLSDNRKARSQIYDMINAMIVINSLCGLNMAQQGVYRRVSFIVNLLAAGIGTDNSKGSKTISGITHNDIALLTNSTRATVSRSLLRLEKENTIVTRKRRIEVLNPRPLLKSTYL